MSAFLISTETMQRVIAAIDIRRVDHFAFMPTDTPAQLDAIGAALFDLNLAALRARYPGERFDAPVYRYRPLGDVSLAARFMACECLVYQCSEGNVPEQPLYQALVALRNGLANAIAHDAVRDEDLPWDWPEHAAA